MAVKHGATGAKVSRLEACIRPQKGGASLMVKNCRLRTRWDKDDLRTDSQGPQFPASQTGILWPTVVAGEIDVVPFQRR